MATVATIMKRAMRLIQVLDPAEEPQSEDNETCITALNAMMNRWEADGISLGWSDVTDGANTLPAPVEAEEAIAYNLAVVIAPEYGVMPSTLVGQGADSGYKAVLRDVWAAQPNVGDVTHMPLGRYGVFNVNTGE